MLTRKDAGVRLIEIYCDGGLLGEETIALVNQVAQSGARIRVLDTQKADLAARARRLGIESLPAVVIDGEVRDSGNRSCCRAEPVDDQDPAADSRASAL